MAYIGNAPVAGAFKKLDNIVFDGTTATFPLTVSTTPTAAGTAQNLIISISGVIQEPGVAYTVSGSNIIFSEAPLITDTFFGVVLGNVGEVTGISDGVVTESKLANDAVTAPKLADGSVELDTATVTGVLSITNGGTGASTAGDALTAIGAQSTLVSGTNIKTVNGSSLLGAGDLAVGDVTLAAAQTLTNKTLGGVVLNDGYTEEVYTFTGVTPEITPNNGGIQVWTLLGGSIPTLGAWNQGQSITLMVNDGPIGTIDWVNIAPVWKTNSGAAPTLNTSGYTVIQLWKVDTTIYGARVGDA